MDSMSPLIPIGLLASLAFLSTLGLAALRWRLSTLKLSSMLSDLSALALLVQTLWASLCVLPMAFLGKDAYIELPGAQLTVLAKYTTPGFFLLLTGCLSIGVYLYLSVHGYRLTINPPKNKAKKKEDEDE